MNKLIVSSELPIEVMEELIYAALEGNATIEVLPDPFKDLRDVLSESYSEQFPGGIISEYGYSNLVHDSTIEISMWIKNQVLFNGIDIGFKVTKDGECHRYYGEDLRDSSTYDDLCGDMAGELGTLYLVLLFGKNIPPEVCDALVEGKIIVEDLDLEDQKTLFSNWEESYQNIIDGKCKVNFEPDFDIGYDS